MENYDDNAELLNVEMGLWDGKFADRVELG
jgi:hypothetical protein